MKVYICLLHIYDGLENRVYVFQDKAAAIKAEKNIKSYWKSANPYMEHIGYRTPRK